MALKSILNETKIDEALVDFIRTFLLVSISVALGLGIPLLDITGGDFRVILSAGLASGLQVLQTYLDPSNSRYGLSNETTAKK